MPIPSSPALVLFLLAPVTAELVSSYLSPLEFFHRLRLAITLFPYGCGAIAAREMVVRQRRGFAGLVQLGMAFGLPFEGIVTRVLSWSSSWVPCCGCRAEENGATATGWPWWSAC
jgi:hypothetical protein